MNEYNNPFGQGLIIPYAEVPKESVYFNPETGIHEIYNKDNQLVGKGTLPLPEVTVRPYRKRIDMSPDVNTLNAITGGALNVLSPSLLVGNAVNIYQYLNGEGGEDWGTVGTLAILGNSGVVSDEFAEEHPILSMGVNMLFDAGAGYTGYKTAQNVDRVANNIANRNYFTYDTLAPNGYNSPFKKGIAIVKNILTKDIQDLPYEPAWLKDTLDNLLGTYLIEDELYDTNANMANAADALATRFRDAAYRKYLGLQEKEPIYLDNGDGTFSYNMDYIRDLYKQYGLEFKPLPVNRTVIPDYITGNAGGTSNKVINFGSGTNPYLKFGIQELEDIWDLHPFSRKGKRLIDRYDKYIGDPLNAKIYKASDKVQTVLRNLGDKIGLNEKELKQFVAEADAYQMDLFDADWFVKSGLAGKLREKLYDFATKVSKLEPTANHLKKDRGLLGKISDKVAKKEVGPILGGEPFTMKTLIPFTENIELVPTADGIGVETNYLYGILSDDLLPQSYFNYKKYGTTEPFKINDLNIQDLNLKNLITPNILITPRR